MKINNVVEPIGSVSELKDKLQSIYIMEDIISLKQEEYLKFVDDIYDIIKGCIEHKECREYIVCFKFKTRDTTTYKMQLRHFLINLFVWYPFTLMPEELNEKWIFDAKNDIIKVHDYINETIELMDSRNIKNTVMNQVTSQVLSMLRSISINFSQIMNLSISAHTFTEVYNTNDRIKDIFFAELPINEQPAIIEAKLADMLKEEIDIFKSVKNNAIGVCLRTGEGIKPKQLQEFTSNGGMKPDINGNTIPIPINGSQLVTGLKKPSNMYLDSTGAHKSYIMNNKVMGKAGDYAKLLILLGTTVALSGKVKNCHTHHLLRITIKNQKMLKKYNGRYYTLNPNKPEKLSILHSKTDTDLIGKTVYFRSPVFCACKVKKGRRMICHTCFGSNAKLNIDIASGIATYLIQTITEPLQQNILSTKHLLTTSSEVIVFSSNFYEIFEFVSGDFKVRHDCSLNLEELILDIPESCLMYDDIYDDDSDTNVYITKSFYIRNIKTGDESIINDENPKKIYIAKALRTLINKYEGKVPISELADESYCMRIDISNNELTKPLYEIMDLTSKTINTLTADSMVQKYTELLVEAGIRTPSVGAEFITAALMRDANSNKDFPDFTFDGDVPYQLLTLTQALSKNKSVVVGLLSHYLKNQLLSPDLSERDAESIHDSLFSEQVSTENLKRFYNVKNDQK